MERQRQETIIFSRTVGWYTPVKNWNLGKQAERKDRVYYSQEKAFNKSFIKAICADCVE